MFDYSPVSILNIIIPMIIVGFCVLYIYLKLSYGFWFYQPVFHLYDFYYYLFPCGIVEKGFPEKNKFTNLTDIVMYPIDKIQNGHLFQQFVSFIKSHYMRNNTNDYIPTVNDTIPYFLHHKHSCFITYYYNNQLLQSTIGNKIITRKQIIGVMTTRPIQIEIKQSSSFSKMYAYYVDYLCVHKKHRKNGIAPQLIQTHYYHQRRKNNIIYANLFKREGELTGIMPLCVYSSYLFDLLSVSVNNILEPNYEHMRCGTQTIDHFVNFVRNPKIKNMFDINICSDLSNLIELVKTNCYFIECIVDTSNYNNIICCFIFKKTNVTIQHEKEVISCIASIRSKECSSFIFINGFKLCVRTFAKSYEYLLIEKLSHNIELCDNLCSEFIPMLTSPMAYFFHNFVHPTINSGKALIFGT